MDDDQASEWRKKAEGAMLPHQRLRLWHAGVELLGVVQREPPGDAELRDQAMRAVRSVCLGIAEGAALEGAHKNRHLRIARASAVEVAAAYELAEAIGERVPRARVEQLATAAYAMLTRMIRPRPRRP
jgi:four helix bundle protein